MSAEAEERLANEIELLQSMYPGQLSYDSKTRELSYAADENRGTMNLRLQDDYLSTSLPDIITASSSNRRDLRDQLKTRVSQLTLGEEILDSVILCFDELVAAVEPGATEVCDPQCLPEKPATIVIYLHHLLNTAKRKQCLHPSSGARISGVTKPGYPGVLIYSGPSGAVHEHVSELKSLNWAAFQIRLESEGEAWVFQHGEGVVEVESMGEVVGEIDVDGSGERKKMFLECMGMK